MVSNHSPTSNGTQKTPPHQDSDPRSSSARLNGASEQQQNSISCVASNQKHEAYYISHFFPLSVPNSDRNQDAAHSIAFSLDLYKLLMASDGNEEGSGTARYLSKLSLIGTAGAVICFDRQAPTSSRLC